MSAVSMTHADPTMRPALLPPEFVDLGLMSYRAAYEEQRRAHESVIAARSTTGARTGAGDAPIAGEKTPAASPGRLLHVQHSPPVITISRRPDARKHLLASPELLARHGIEVAETDRGGDITYHGPGQLVVYPIVDLNLLGWSLHRYMRELERAVIGVCAQFGVRAGRIEGATGVWVGEGAGARKLCALGVRVRKWVTMHGLALNVTTNLDHFGLIVPCGLAGRAVTSLEHELGAACPALADVQHELQCRLGAAMAAAPDGADTGEEP